VAEITQYKCDGCGAIKGEANHWWLASNLSGSLAIAPWDGGWAVDRAQHYCGAACVHKALDAFMGAK